MQQNIQVLQTTKYGRVLVLDGVIQFTEFDEFAYHEMMAHIPLFCHPNPVSVRVSPELFRGIVAS